MKFIDDKYYSIGLDPHLPFLLIAANKEDQEKRIDFNTTLGRWDIFGTFYILGKESSGYIIGLSEKEIKLAIAKLNRENIPEIIQTLKKGKNQKISIFQKF